MLDLRTLPRAPEFCLDTLLACLRDVPDGFDTIRQADGTWELRTAWDCIPVHPAYQCGFTQDGQGRLLTAVQLAATRCLRRLDRNTLALRSLPCQ